MVRTIHYLDVAPKGAFLGAMRITFGGVTLTCSVLRGTDYNGRKDRIYLYWPIKWPHALNQHLNHDRLLRDWIALRRFYLWARGVKHA